MGHDNIVPQLERKHLPLSDLTPEQIELISIYWQQWQEKTLSTEPIDRQKAAVAVRALYELAGQHEPEIFFVESPRQYYAQAFLRTLSSSSQENGALEQHLKSNPENRFIRDPQPNIAGRLATQLQLPVERLGAKSLRRALNKIKQGKSRAEAISEARAEVYSPEADRQLRLLSQINEQFCQQCGASANPTNSAMFSIAEDCSWMGAVYRVLHQNLQLPQELLINIVDTGYRFLHGVNDGCIDCCALAFASARFDYCVSVLGFEADSSWEIIQSLVPSLGSILFPYEDFCVICDRPCVLSLNDQQHLHAQAQPAIEFGDGFGIYVFDGVLLPEQYCSLPPVQWQPEWILNEPDAVVKRRLIQTIGYARIFQELEGTVLETWRDYSLVEWSGLGRVLRKMDSNTGDIAVWNLPYYVKSLHDALRWLNFPHKDLSWVPTERLLWLHQFALYSQSPNLIRHLTRRTVQAIKDWNQRQPTQATQFSITKTLLSEVTGGACRGIPEEFAIAIAEYNQSLNFPKFDNLSPKRSLKIQSLAEIITIQSYLG
ncbi:MAG: DUF6745 domain-containing protein [Cyanobacteriota bacterium]